MNVAQRIAVEGRRAFDFCRQQRAAKQARALHVLEQTVLRALDLIRQRVANRAVDLVEQRVHELVEDEVVVAEEIAERFLIIGRQHRMQKSRDNLLADGLPNRRWICVEQIARRRNHAGEIIRHVLPGQLEKLLQAVGVLKNRAERLIETTRNGTQLCLHLRELVADVLDVALNLVERRINVREQRIQNGVAGRADERAGEAEIRRLAVDNFFDNRGNDFAVAGGRIFGDDALQQSGRVQHIGERLVHGQHNAAGLVGNIVQHAYAILQRAAGGDGVIDLLKKGGDVGLLIRSNCWKNIGYDWINRRVQNRIHKILHVFAQHFRKLVDAGDIQRLVELAANGVGHAQERADVAVERVVDEVEHFDTRQLHCEVLRKIKIHLAGREFLEPAVHVENRQLHFGVLKTLEAAESAVERERIIERRHVQPVALGAWMILRVG